MRPSGFTSGGDLGSIYQQMLSADPAPAVLKKISASLANKGMAPLSGCTPDGLARALADSAATWAFSSKVEALKNRTA